MQAGLFLPPPPASCWGLCLGWWLLEDLGAGGAGRHSGWGSEGGLTTVGLRGHSNTLSPSPVPFPSPHRKVPPFPTAQSPPPPLSFLQVVR